MKQHEIRNLTVFIAGLQTMKKDYVRLLPGSNQIEKIQVQIDEAKARLKKRQEGKHDLR